MSYLYIFISGLVLLGIWSIANILLWLLNVRKAPRGSITYYRWQANGLINLIYLFVVLISALMVMNSYERFSTDFDFRMTTAVIVMLATVLSAVMIAIGNSLTKSKKKQTSRNLGIGKSLTYQGVCLLIFMAILSQFLMWTA